MEVKTVYSNGDLVVILHGIGHIATSMSFFERAFKRQGYKTLNLTYPSVKYSINDLVVWLKERLEKECIWDKNGKVHFVAHSMGGLVSGFYLERYKESIPIEKMGRVVMLGTPHGGSEVADYLQGQWIYKKIFGPAGQMLTTSVRDASKIKPWYDLGVIAGRRNWMYPLGKIFIKGAHDGCVSVESTKVEGMKDHLVCPVLHGSMYWNKAVHAHTIDFLKYGEFKR